MLESNNNNSSYTISGNLVKYYGFYYPPKGVIGVLNLLLVPADACFYIIDPLLEEELPYEEIAEQKNPYVIITTQEGASYYWFDKLIPKLVEHGVALDHIILRSACLWDPDSPVKRIHTIVDECTDFISGIKNREPNVNQPSHHFVCLNRLHRWQRYELVKTILDRNLDQFGKLSYIEIPEDNTDTRFLNLTRPDVDWNEQRNIDSPEIAGALFNIINEAAFEPEPGATELINHHRPGMTEKSYKCFALFQIPLWLAPYRAVNCYRDLGFDVFDDIVDHGYDLEPDPEKRIYMLADQVEKICQISTKQMVTMKQELLPRFRHNLARLHHFANNFDTEMPQWQVLFQNNKSN